MQTRTPILAVTFLAACVTQRAKPEQAAFGSWRVTGSTCPTECAISRVEADAWRGRTARYEESGVRFAEISCKGPRYNVSYWPATGLYGGARLTDLGITADSVLVIDLQCPTQPRTGSDPRWQVAGSFLIVKNRDHLLAVWEGVFFELTRQ
jgi:hypothetical protein